MLPQCQLLSSSECKLEKGMPLAALPILNDNDFLCLNETWKPETGVHSHRSLSKIVFGHRADFAVPATLERSMIKADLSSKELGASGAIIVAAFLPRW